ncbi:MAG: 2,3-bisphosphoglycerate-independent phosphoglycerate mutase [Chloroflexi bacterium]|nr:2,3-bisphosphoglycerate-independent phosphoglycerate mutase [Chloroflexota bacterium]
MDQLELMRDLSIPGQSKIVLLLLDGLGGLPGPNGSTELEAAHTPNLDRLAQEGISGLSTPVAPGITPGSGPGHVAIFGYDPLAWDIGRGVLEALGIDFALGDDDVAARGNFCTVDRPTGVITDRRAGRISSDVGARLVEKLRGISLPGAEALIEPVKEYRFVLVLRGKGLADGLSETDPQRTGVPPLPVEALRPEAGRAAELFNLWLAEARRRLADEHPANSMNLRGMAKVPPIPKMPDIYKMRFAAIATYPMYRGIARLVGMDVLKTGETIEDEIATLRANWEQYDFFFFHVKKTDSNGEDGNFDGKKAVIEHVDELLPEIMALKPDVLLVSGDHSTPWSLKAHSWHELPVLLWGRHNRPDAVRQFGERACMAGGLGHLRHTDLMPLMMAHAERLTKYGA